jgi:hypothetical protein
MQLQICALHIRPMVKNRQLDRSGEVASAQSSEPVTACARSQGLLRLRAEFTQRRLSRSLCGRRNGKVGREADDGAGFQFVPWRPALEQQLGKQVGGVMAPGARSIGPSAANAGWHLILCVFVADGACYLSLSDLSARLGAAFMISTADPARRRNCRT